MISASMPVCSCDRCGCRLDRGSLRYEMKVGVRLAPAAWLLTDDDLEEDHLHAVARMLSDLPEDQPARRTRSASRCVCSLPGVLPPLAPRSLGQPNVPLNVCAPSDNLIRRLIFAAMQ